MKLQVFESRVNYVDSKIDTVTGYDTFNDFDELKEIIADSCLNERAKEAETFEQLQEIVEEGNDEMVLMFDVKHVSDMNLSWNYTKCHSNHFDYCGDENLADWLRKQGMEPNEIHAAVEVADDYLEGLEKDGRDCACVIWFD